MQIGKLSKMNMIFLEQISSFGFKNKTDVIDKSLTLLRKKIQKEKRKKELENALNDYSRSQVENYFESIDGDDFESR